MLYFNTAEAAKLLKGVISKRTLESRIQDGTVKTIRAVRFGRENEERLIELEDLAGSDNSLIMQRVYDLFKPFGDTTSLYFTIQQASRLRGISKQWVIELIEKKRVRVTLSAGRRYIPESQMLRITKGEYVAAFDRRDVFKLFRLADGSK